MSIFKLIYNVKSTLAYVFSLIAFPLTCISCGSQAYGVALCKECQNEFVHGIAPKEQRCKTCGVLLISEKDVCLDCRAIDEEKIQSCKNNRKKRYEIVKDFESIFPIHQYVLWKKELLFAWKIANNRSLTAILAKTLKGVLNTNYENIPIVPVPPRKGKIKTRGWDQIDELCTYLQVFYNIPVHKILERFSKDEQKKRTREERLDNIEKNYSVMTNLKYIPKEVVLVDDIMTTGATLESCAKALKQAGVEKVHAVTIFYV